MYYIEKMDLTHQQQVKLEPIETSWEFAPTDCQKSACEFTKALALRSDGNSQIRVVGDEEEHIIATYLVTKRLIVSTANGLFTEEIVSGMKIPTISKIGQ